MHFEPIVFAFVAFGMLAPAIAPASRALPGATPRRALAFVCASLALVAPWYLPAEEITLRSILALQLSIWWLRVLQLVRVPGGRPLLERLALTYTFLDPRITWLGPRRYDLKLFAFGCIGVSAGVWTITHAYAASTPYLRLLVGVVGFYWLAGGFERFMRAWVGAFGFYCEPLHRAPIRSASLTEFWGVRWNRVIGAYLRDHAFRPLLRYTNPTLATLLAFALSALLHAYPMWVGLGVRGASFAAAFFMVHGVLLTIERYGGVARWPRPLGRAFVIACFLLTMPLFAEPFFLSLGVL